MLRSALPESLLRNGFNVCSRRDPIGEAHHWLMELLKKDFDFNNQESLLVLGGGLGFHLIAVLEKFPSALLTVFEPSVEFQNYFLRKHSDFSPRINWVSDSKLLLQSELVGLRCLTFRPSWQGDQSSFVQALKDFKQAQAAAFLKPVSLTADDRQLCRILLSCVAVKKQVNQCA